MYKHVQNLQKLWAAAHSELNNMNGNDKLPLLEHSHHFLFCPVLLLAQTLKTPAKMNPLHSSKFAKSVCENSHFSENSSNYAHF